MRMGSSGVALLKPDANGGLTTTTQMSPQEGQDEYDEVTEDKKNSTVSTAETSAPVSNPWHFFFRAGRVTSFLFYILW